MSVTATSSACEPRCSACTPQPGAEVERPLDVRPRASTRPASSRRRRCPARGPRAAARRWPARRGRRPPTSRRRRRRRGAGRRARRRRRPRARPARAPTAPSTPRVGSAAAASATSTASPRPNSRTSVAPASLEVGGHPLRRQHLLAVEGRGRQRPEQLGHPRDGVAAATRSARRAGTSAGSTRGGFGVIEDERMPWRSPPAAATHRSPWTRATSPAREVMPSRA